MLVHGRTRHGRQFDAAEKRALPTTYYGIDSGVGLVLKHATQSGRRVGVVGLGTGTLAAYAQPNDYYRFYEINPDVIRLAQQHFTFLKDCPARFDLVLGDARLSLERDPAQNFDVLVLDAFSSDAIPVHLLTREAWDIYRRHLRPNGVLAIHISNRYFDLRPVIERLGEYCGWRAVYVASKANSRVGQQSAHWMIVTGNSEMLDAPEWRAAIATRSPSAPPDFPLWTDSYTNVIRVLK